jgi:hypothetical protein
LSCSALAANPGLIGQQNQAIAHVIDIKGDWRVQGANTPLVAGTPLASGAHVTAASNHAGDAITILRDEDLFRIPVICDSSATNPCRNPIVVSAAAAAPAAKGQFMADLGSIFSILISAPPAIQNHFAVTLSRGKHGISESEDVVALDPAQMIALPNAPSDMPAGQYPISIARAGSTTPTNDVTAQLTSDGSWNPIPFKSTGLFEVSILNSAGDPVADWFILVVPTSQYHPLREKFDALHTQTASWTGPGARRDQHRFLRAFLFSETRP